MPHGMRFARRDRQHRLVLHYTRLAFALKGDIKKGLFFRGSEGLPFGAAIRPVAELLEYFLTGRMPAFG